MNAGKRSKAEIYSDILESVNLELTQSKRASPTRVAHRANLPYDRFQKVLDQLVEIDLVLRTDEGLTITEKGTKVLREMQKSKEFLRRMGLLT